ncbi:hypothetical protein GQX73_g10456 [Xylaria multiplex]|uniref:Uncharacterized protein n=1 Tax=Xylaria multiplex TaxID=323545 RepID=A0A7C8IL33_9PEZI|nr:hypothetical protein GQX73_g10456 [Xylaria multiplex]
MRLLTTQPDGSLALTEDLNEDIPQYAILSHTWGSDNEEVTFRDISEGTGQQKEGYRKIEFCRDWAASDRLRYFWVDTCCIDRSNSTELSEAINSMFRWYQTATKCYVYLSDVSKSDAEHVNEPLQSTWKGEFRKTRWLTRSWTLQELIAPSSVEFFGRDGQRLGNKKSLEQLLHDTTKISIDALRGYSLSNISIDERMSWSSGRNAKRPEDKAYSLMGIFNVYMPLLYGEGEEEAILRLRGGINIRSGRLVLDKLPTAMGASFDSHAEEHNPTCLPNTRVELLREINEWIGDPHAKALFWLNGMAGTGKSTISRTLARSSFKSHKLGASFFFKRGEGDRGGASKFFTTITAQLVQQVPGLALYVGEAIENNPGLSEKSLEEQFDKLIFKPLTRLISQNQKSDVLVIVVDALDECDRDKDVQSILNLLSRANRDPIHLRIFLTSRPELPIRLGFHDIKGTYEYLILHEISQPIIESDLSVYFPHELEKIRIQYNKSVPKHRQLQSTWPFQSDIKILVKMAIPLFIFAATICRFLADRRTGAPDIKLRKTLEQQTKSQNSKLDATYLPVLQQLLVDLSDSEKNEVLGLFKRLVGSIVLLAEPLSTSALAHLLDIPKDAIDNQLDSLHSVLSIPSSPNALVRLLHLSFRDFLVNPSKCGKNPFWVDEKEAHKQLADDCLRIMNKTLRTDICDVRWPGTRYADIDQQIISNKLTPEVQYACQYWVHHVKEAGNYLFNVDQVHRFLQQHFLHWLEALCLMGIASECDQSLKTLKSLLQYFRMLEGHTDTVYLVAFSSDGKIIASVSKDGTIRLWSTDTGTHLRILKGCTSPVRSVVFSSDGKTIASGSTDYTIRLWSADTGTHLRTFEGHKNMVWSVAFSSDGKTIASGSGDGTIRLWSADTGTHLRMLEGHTGIVYSVALSSDGKTIASRSKDRTTRLWSADTGGCLRSMYTGPASFGIAFDPDNRFLSTGTGTVPLGDLLQLTPIITTNIGKPSTLRSFLQKRRLGYGISEDGRWVTFNGEELFWIPEYYQGRAAIFESAVAIGTYSGEVVIMR